MKKLEKCSEFSKLEGVLHCIILVTSVLLLRHLKWDYLRKLCRLFHSRKAVKKVLGSMFNQHHFKVFFNSRSMEYLVTVAIPDSSCPIVKASQSLTLIRSHISLWTKFLRRTRRLSGYLRLTSSVSFSEMVSSTAAQSSFAFDQDIVYSKSNQNRSSRLCLGPELSDNKLTI